MKPEDFADDANYTRFEGMFYGQLVDVWTLLYGERTRFRHVLSSTVNNEFIVSWFISLLLTSGFYRGNPGYMAEATAQLAVLLDRHRSIRG